MKISSLTAALVLLSAAALAADAEPRSWALGWADGITLRHQVARNWDLNLAAGPYDRWEESDRTVWDDDDPPAEQGYSFRPSDDKREQGWVELGAGRFLSGEGPLRLSGLLSLRYLWSREQDYSENVYDPGTNESLRLTKTNSDVWSLDLALRVSAALSERFWLETRFGLVYSWREINTRTTDRRLNGVDYTETVEEGLTRLKTFDDYGWSGTSSLDLVFWF